MSIGGELRFRRIIPVWSEADHLRPINNRSPRQERNHHRYGKANRTHRDAPIVGLNNQRNQGRHNEAAQLRAKRCNTYSQAALTQKPTRQQYRRKQHTQGDCPRCDQYSVARYEAPDCWGI